MANTLSERDWSVLLRRIGDGKCTPFLGAGACYGVLPLGGQLAREWAQAENYPFPDESDLVRVAQFIALKYDAITPKEMILRRFANVAPPNFREPDEPHALLADLPLPVYMTTNYDDFMMQALKNRHRDARRELCRWNPRIVDTTSVFDRDPNFTPTVANPIVFHLHGFGTAESLVLTEDDYLEFLGAMARDGQMLPPRIQTALSNASLLFIGYRIADWNFRVLFQGLRPTGQFLSVAVLVPPSGDSDDARRHAQDYLDRYYAAMDLRVYWGTAREFCTELRRRWQEFLAG